MGEALRKRAVALMLKPSFTDPRIARTRLSGIAGSAVAIGGLGAVAG